MKRSAFTLVSMLLFASLSHAQTDSLAKLLEIPIEQLLDVPIYSVSKSAEKTFDVTRTSAVVTRGQIRKAGCRSIAEALRLVPGVIVREQTNGNYDVHLRGLDNIPPNSNLHFFSNSTTLVMIDNRPVYNYLHGGTFWDALPIGLNDIEQIEVVFGPADATYGPNAVSGVINIITRKPKKKGWYGVGNAQYGNYKSLVSGASIGYKPGNKFSFVLSGNYTQLGRTQADYYDIAQNRYVVLDSVVAVKNNPLKNTDQAYPHRDIAYQPAGYNAFINYAPGDKTQLSLSLGGQHSYNQDEFGTGLTFITPSNSSTKYAQIKGNVHNFSFMLSEMFGTQAPVIGLRTWQWNLRTTDANAEYIITGIKHLTIIPGFSYRTATYDDSKYINTSINEGLWNGSATNSNIAGSLRLDYRVFDNKLRLTAGTRTDFFTTPKRAYPSIQVAATYRIDDKNILRAMVGSANRTPLLFDLFANSDLEPPRGANAPTQPTLLQVRGNKNIELLSANCYEVGYRTRIHKGLTIDACAYYFMAKDFSDVVIDSGKVNSAGVLVESLDLNNLTVHTRQLGATISVNWDIKKWDIRPFVSVQRTWLIDYSPYRNTAAAVPQPINNFDPANNNIYSGMGTTQRSLATPTVYGGAYVNWAINNKWNANVTAYFFSDQTQLESSNLIYMKANDPRGQQDVNAKLLLNAVVGFKPTPTLYTFVNIRNMLNNRSVEFFKGDAPAYLILVGVYFDWEKAREKKG